MKPQLPEEFTPRDLQMLDDQLKLRTSAAQEMLKLMLENTILFDAKQMDYGPKNISSFGTFGVVVRMNDKFERIKSLFNKGRRRRAVNESIRDTFRDISIYAMIAYMLEVNKWPEVDKGREDAKPTRP